MVSGFAELLESRGEKLGPEERAEFTARLAEAARELRAILDRAGGAPDRLTRAGLRRPGAR